MKKIITCFFLTTLMISCNNNDKKEPSAVEETETIPGTNLSQEFPLLNKYDCGTCHKKDEKVQGPSYSDIASKYAGKADIAKYLSQKITEGGSGVWGTVPMNPHPGMPKQDLDSIVAYILSLKK